MVTINPQDVKPGEVYEGTVDGKRLTLRRTPDNAYEWESFSDVHDDREVTNLVCLVPAREVTRQDLPDLYAAYSKVMRSDCGDLTPSDLGPVLDAVVAHLNANGGTPVVMGQAANNMLRETLANVETDRDRWRRAHEIVEQERDQARESLRGACKVAQSYKVDAYQATERAEAAERERDEAVKRADGLASDLASCVVRAEAAEARTAVTRGDVSDVVHGVFSTWYDNEDMVDAVCALFGVEAEPADPVEPEGDVIVRDAHDRMWWVTDDGWTNGTSRLDHDWADVPKPIRVTYRAESETKR